MLKMNNHENRKKKVYLKYLKISELNFNWNTVWKMLLIQIINFDDSSDHVLLITICQFWLFTQEIG